MISNNYTVEITKTGIKFTIYFLQKSSGHKLWSVFDMQNKGLGWKFFNFKGMSQLVDSRVDFSHDSSNLTNMCHLR